MARAYRARPDGLFEVETPGVGFMPVHWGEDQLRGNGFIPYQGATADDFPDMQATGGGGVGNVPEPAPRNVTDVPREVPGATGAGGAPSTGIAPGAWDPSMGGAPPQSMPNTGAEGQPSDVKAQTPTPPEARAPATGREAIKTKPLSQAGRRGPGADGSSAPRFGSTKARDIRAGFRVEKGPQVSPETQADLDASYGAQDIAAMDQADREQVRAKRDADFFGDKIVKPLERQVSVQELKAERVRQDFEKRQGEIDKERKEVDAMEVNPRQIWDDAPWAMALAAVSMLAGGALSGWQGGGPNQGADLIQRAMDMNVEAQKNKIANRREGLRDKETELERLTKIYGSPEMAEEELRSRQEALITAWAKHNVMKDAAEDVQANLQSYFAEKDLERAKEREQRDVTFGDKVTEEWRYQPAQTVQVGGRRPLKPDERKRKVRIDGQEGFVVSDSQQRPVQEAADGLGFIVEQLGEYSRIAADTSLGPEEKKKALASMKRNIGTTGSVLQGQGAMAVEEIKGLDETLGTPEDMIGATENDLARINATRNFYQGKRQRLIQSNVYADPDANQPFAPPVPSRQVDQ